MIASLLVLGRNRVLFLRVRVGSRDKPYLCLISLKFIPTSVWYSHWQVDRGLCCAVHGLRSTPFEREGLLYLETIDWRAL